MVKQCGQNKTVQRKHEPNLYLCSDPNPQLFGPTWSHAIIFFLFGLLLPRMLDLEGMKGQATKLLKKWDYTVELQNCQEKCLRSLSFTRYRYRVDCQDRIPNLIILAEQLPGGCRHLTIVCNV